MFVNGQPPNERGLLVGTLAVALRDQLEAEAKQCLRRQAYVQMSSAVLFPASQEASEPRNPMKPTNSGRQGAEFSCPVSEWTTGIGRAEARIAIVVLVFSLVVIRVGTMSPNKVPDGPW